DTGAMFRAMALYCIRHDISQENEAEISAACEQIQVTLTYQDGEQQVLLNGENVNALIRTEEVGTMASGISIYQAVRSKLLNLQRKLASTADVVMDGRDIGTCVLPKAQVKIYLTASVATRGKRRFLELQGRGISCNLQEICADIEKRDAQDQNRKIAPLRQAQDAILVDSSQMDIFQVVDTILGFIKQVQKKEIND
ncbi:MAG: (d)CMP kinase, partial [Lachnospiraceae bacterium]